MKKILLVGGLFLVVIMIGIFAIQVNKQDTDVTREQTKVGFILNGEVSDHSWGQSHYEGMKASAKELNLDVDFRECVPEDENCKETIEELIREGCEIIFCNSFGYGEYEMEVAKKHPDIYFFHATGVEEAHNMSTYFGRIYQMRYLSGIVAGMQTESNQIGYVAAFDISEVNRGINAFTLGVRSVNPEANVYVEWCNSWGDYDMTADATNSMLGKHPKIDVLTVHHDSLASYDIAQERGIWTIGYNMDNSALYPDTFLTAPVWEWEHFYIPRIRECLQNKFESRHYWESADTGVVSLAPLTGNVKEGIKEVVEEEQKRLEEGTFDVFYGPIIDRDGVVRVAEGESLTDDVMLNSFDWYVEGVVIDEE